MKEITINWHIIEKCNYGCYYCFAKYSKHEKKEIQHSKKDIEYLLENLYSYFSNKYIRYSIRLNIAGGEPTLAQNLNYIIEKAYLVGFKVSIITNASKLNNKFIEINASYLSMCAISVDSLNEETNIKIGRVANNGFICKNNLIKMLSYLKFLNPLIQLKINTVVNEHNYMENMNNFIDSIHPDKWKILQALSIGDANQYCKNGQYNIFVANNQNKSLKIYKESKDDMKDSYIMIDPYGRFYQNTHLDYEYSESMLIASVEEAFKSIKFDLEKFKKRYEQ